MTKTTYKIDKTTSTPEVSQKKHSSRILTFDLLRGFFLFVIIINHLILFPSGYEIFSARSSMLVTTAEGFFLLSGLMLGLVRGRKLIGAPIQKPGWLLLRRGAHLYVISLILMLAFTAIGHLFIDNPGLKPGIRPLDEPWWDILVGAITLKYIYGWADYLRLYALFILVSPVVLWLLRKGWWYIALAGSVGLWMLYPDTTGIPHAGEVYQPISWQLIFFIGFIIGFYLQDIREWWSKKSSVFRKSVAIPVLSFAFVTFTLDYLAVMLPGAFPDLASFHASIAPLFNKYRVTLPLLFLFLTWFALGYAIVRRFESFFLRYTGWIFLRFGQNSLYVYILHAIIIFFVHLVFTPYNTNYGFVTNFLVTTFVITLILLAVRIKFLMKIIPR